MVKRLSDPSIQIGKLGKAPVKHDPRTLQLARYLDVSALPSLPKNLAWQSKVPPGSWPMLANDRFGDCVEAAAGHSIHLWTANAQATPVVVTDQDVLSAYTAITGFNPSDPSTDQGTNELDALNYWRKTGIANHKIQAFVQIDPKSKSQVKYAIDLFGVAYIGIALPLTAQTQPYWHVTRGEGARAKPNSWGGHAVVCTGYTKSRVQLITWGQVMEMTWGFFMAYVDEAYALLSASEWFTSSGTAPNGLNLQQLQSDLQQITHA